MTERKLIQFFISYAHADDELASKLIEAFKEMSIPSKKYKYEFWQDTAILPGEKWKEEIQNALNECSVGLLLISPAFLGSEFIGKNELSTFIGEKTKPAVPVMLKKVNMKRHDLKGLEDAQIFRLKAGDAKNMKSYAQCVSRQKDGFVYELFDRVECLLDKVPT